MEAVTKIKAADSPFSDSLFFAAGALSREIEKLALECWKPTGLSPSLGQVIYFLIHYVEITGPMVVAQNLFLDPSTVTRLLEKLEKKGLVLLLFEKRCKALLGEQTNLICPLLTATADTLRSGTNVRKPTAKAAGNTDLHSEN